MAKQHIHIIKMGGTIEFIDPAYDEINTKLLRLDTTVESYLNHLINPHFTFSVESLVAKDSRAITDDDRKKLAHMITQSGHENILITHGTFTLQDTTHFLSQQSLDQKKVILTGSMVPIVGFSASDAGFNLGFAIASFSAVSSGVYLSMNGGIFGADEVKKNEAKFRFE